MVINPELSLLDKSAQANCEPEYIVKRTHCPCQFRQCVAGYMEGRIRINPAVSRIPYAPANFKKSRNHIVNAK